MNTTRSKYFTNRDLGEKVAAKYGKTLHLIGKNAKGQKVYHFGGSHRFYKDGVTKFKPKKSNLLTH